MGIFRRSSSARVDDQRVGSATVSAVLKSPEGRFVAGFDECRCGAIAEDGAQAAICGMDVFAVGFGRDQQDAPDGFRADQAIGQRQPVDETGATEIEINGSARFTEPQSFLHQAGGCGERVVGRLGTEQQEIDARRVDIVRGKEFFGGFDSQIGGAFVRSGNMAARDTRFGIDQIQIPTRKFSGQLFVGFDLFG